MTGKARAAVLASGLVGCLCGWLAGWLAGGLADWLVAELAGRLPIWLAGWLEYSSSSSLWDCTCPNVVFYDCSWSLAVFGQHWFPTDYGLDMDTN